MKSKLFAATLIATLYGCSVIQASEIADLSGAIRLSIVSVLADPAKASGHRIRLSGYLADTEGPYLYLTRDFAELEDYLTAIPVEADVDFQNSHCLNKYVSITGEYGKVSFGRFGFTDVLSVDLASDGLFPDRCYAKIEE